MCSLQFTEILNNRFKNFNLVQNQTKTRYQMFGYIRTKFNKHHFFPIDGKYTSVIEQSLYWNWKKGLERMIEMFNIPS